MATADGDDILGETTVAGPIYRLFLCIHFAPTASCMDSLRERNPSRPFQDPSSAHAGHIPISGLAGSVKPVRSSQNNKSSHPAPRPASRTL